jgi:Ala-tRNA(Pro) deacylase
MILTKLETLLDVHGISYTHTIHKPAFTAREVAKAEDVPVNRIAKCIVFFGEEGYGIAVIPGDRKVDLHELRALFNQPHLRLATEDELRKLFPESELGAMPPFGNHLELPVFVDNSLAAYDTIAFNAGTHSDVVHMHFLDFERLSGATILPCAVAVSARGAGG